RKALRSWVAALLVTAILLIPWFGQLWALAHSGYQGAANGIDPGLFVTRFWSTLALGEIWATGAPDILLIGIFAALLVSLIAVWRRYPGPGMLIALWLAIPSILLIAAATRLNVFLPRYLIASTPALLLVLAVIFADLLKSQR